MSKSKQLLLLLLGPLMIGCAAMGVMETKDPNRKLADAYDLLWHQDRPLPADRLILEAIDIYRQQNNEKGLAIAYTRYAELLGSRVAERYATLFKRNDFLDHTPYDKRFERSIEYLKMAREIEVRENNYEAIGNADFKMGIVYENMKQTTEACSSYSQTLLDIKDYQKNVPNAKVNYPPNFASFDDYITAQKKRVGCP